ncbi:MAG: T9SS type A sorting domain-containing protein [Bacteroidetes bacterium]|nr:T9SS type A sorting domain-containing protein [Bacteroidota bacterium]
MTRLVFILTFCFSTVNAQHWQDFSSPSVIGPYSLYYDSLADTLYCGGRFINHQLDTVWEVAFWSGVVWETICDSDLGYPPLAIVKYNSSIYIGGDFPNSGGGSNYSVLRFNGQSWDSIPGAPVGNVMTLELFQNNLYLGGSFYSSQDPTVSNVQYFDGTSWFSMFTSGLWHVASVQKLKEWDGSLYVAGSWALDSLGDYIMRWTGTGWDSLLHGITPSGDIGAGVNALESYNGKLFVGGSFYPFNAIDRNIQAWNGSDWEAVGGGSENVIYDLTVFENNLYAVGSFFHVGHDNIPAMHIARWDGAKWCGLGSTINASCGRILSYKGDLIVVGAFSVIDGNFFNKIAAWIGGNYADTCSAVGIIEPNETSFLIFPNPARTHLLISFSLPLNEESEIIIKDISGRELKREHLRNQTALKQIDISEFASGIYFLTLQSEHRIFANKFIKQ